MRIGAILAMGAGAPAYEWAVGLALDAGATAEEIVGVVIAVAPSIGVARVVPAAPVLGLALGYDIEAALERPDVRCSTTRRLVQIAGLETIEANASSIRWAVDAARTLIADLGYQLRRR